MKINGKFFKKVTQQYRITESIIIIIYMYFITIEVWNGAMKNLIYKQI